ncbi:hypothetical protein BG262_05335 [Floricoccus penangensis]|uniref:VTC domain-containing protein n=1 Tax=Floricoccus penangensis TaxID=1859475 RepID=A0A9Q5JG43_9LACT|nr:polyphosphate polymerase domain-containing protein [Floricoccus penangensis]OFI46439.1 hypothetical protein BG262_05335 [Floricoccus penangensis]
MKLKNVFQRQEVKYTLTFEQYEKLRVLLKDKLFEDQYGLHTIYSLYYDTDNFDMIRKSIEKPDYKEKFRIRSYGLPTADSNVYLEIKKKVNGIVYKRRVEQPYSALNLIDTYTALENPFQSKNSQVNREITYLFSRQVLEPKVLIAYDRKALYTPEDENFRVTFDFNIRYSLDELDFQEDGMKGVSPDVDVLMEVKSLASYPLWFSKALSDIGAFKASYSKYARVYKDFIVPRENFKELDRKIKEIGEKAYA